MKSRCSYIFPLVYLGVVLMNSIFIFPRYGLIVGLSINDLVWMATSIPGRLVFDTKVYSGRYTYELDYDKYPWGLFLEIVLISCVFYALLGLFFDFIDRKIKIQVSGGNGSLAKNKYAIFLIKNLIALMTILLFLAITKTAIGLIVMYTLCLGLLLGLKHKLSQGSTK